MTKGTSTIVSFQFERETKGAVRFQEVDDKGNVLSMGDGAKIGTLYIRKSAFNGEGTPKKIQLAVTVQD